MIINDDDVQAVAMAFDCTFDIPHAAFLKAGSSCDLNACPGSGKTTLLVAKLAILAKKWCWRDRGVLVLSHTNVARKEVENRLAKCPSAAALLAYPHFIGTIQGFVDRFLALPYLRDTGVGNEPVVEIRIDDDAFAARATALFLKCGWKDYGTARSYLKRHHNEGLGTIATLVYANACKSLRAEDGKLPGPETPTTRQLRALKDRLASEGFFRFADMFAYAQACLEARPFMRAALRRRFPWVFIDEMQDTSGEQAALLDSIFQGPDVVLHRAGDRNQAIYGEAVADVAQCKLAWTGSVDLCHSQRLAPRIAELVSPLTVMQPMLLRGNPKRKDRNHTIFLFDDKTITGVLGSFGELILEEWPDGLPADFTAKAVGFRRRPQEGTSLPGSLVDYWHAFAPAPKADACLTPTFLGTVLDARRMVAATGEFGPAHRLVSDGLAVLITHQEGVRTTRRGFEERCRAGMLDSASLKKLITLLLMSPCVDNESSWRTAAAEACRILFDGGQTQPVADYLAWAPDLTGPGTSRRTHLYVHQNGERSVAIEITTIHSVKGETHDATLVLETFYREHDLRAAVPILLGGELPPKRKTLPEHMRRLYVGSTRPRELLCLAFHRDHVTDDQIHGLRERGWAVTPVPSTGLGPPAPAASTPHTSGA